MAKPIVVALASGHKGTLQQAQATLAQVLGMAGCGHCFSGRDIHFVEEIEVIQTAGARVQPQQIREG